MATLPAAATNVHLDSMNDDPRQARAEISGLAIKHNQLQSALGDVAVLDAGTGLTANTTHINLAAVIDGGEVT